MGSVPPYQIMVDGFAPEHFRVHSFTGNEAMSEAWSFDVIVTCDEGGGVERVALGQRATLLFNLGEQQRAFYGIVAAVRLVQVHHADHSIKYQVRVVPRLWLLKRKKRTRIFQKMRVTDIVNAVLDEAGIAARWQLSRAYPTREYCTQYEETDYRFIKRLLAEAAIYFYFPTGPALDSAAMAADTALGVAASAGGSILGAVAGAEVGGLVGSAISVASTLIPGDTVICADDASCYPPMNGDDPAALAASTAAALAPVIGDLAGAGNGAAGAVIGTASAVAGKVIAEVSSASHEVPVLHFVANEEASVSRLDKLTRFALRNEMRPTSAVFRDYDPERPLVRLHSAAVSTKPFPPSPFEAAAMAVAAAENAASVVENVAPLPGAAKEAIHSVESAVETTTSVVNGMAGAAGQKVPHEVYEHHSPFLFPKWAFANDEAPRMLRQMRRRASIATGEGGCPYLSPGHRFQLQAHPAAHLDETYVVTCVEHRGQTHPEPGRAFRVYGGTFECAPSEMTYVPPRPKRKSTQVSLTATVVGPAGEEIYVDPMGQIKVQFHWDRDGKHDDKSSCWVRVLQPWAGASWGHQFIPRVGMEVVVVFEGGDPDKPMVLGSLYNGTHPPSFILPEDKTKSGIKTRSTPGGEGFNEIMFDDAKGGEVLALRAQRDLVESVLNDQRSTIGGSTTMMVGANRKTEIQGEDRLEVRGGCSARVQGGANMSIGGDSVSACGGSRQTDVAGDDSTRVAGGHTLMATKFSHVLIGQGAESGHGLVYVNGDYRIAAAEELQLSATKGLKLVCGDSMIEMSPKGITLTAPALTLAAAAVSCAAGENALHMGETVEIKGKEIKLFSKDASIVLDEDAKIDGQLVKLNCDETRPRPKDDEPGADETGTITFHVDPHLKSDDGPPLTLVIAMPDGKTVEKQADSDGKVTLDGKKGERYVLVDVRKGKQSLSKKPS